MLSTKNSRWIAGTCAACVAVTAVSWFLLISPRRSHAADLRDQTQSVASANDTLRLQIAQLKAQFADLPKQKAELVTVQQELPPTAAMPTLVRSLNGIADSTGVNLDSVTPGTAVYASAAGTPGASGAAGTPGAAGSGGAAGSVITLPVSVAVTGDYFAATLFMKQLQTKLRRAFLVTGITVSLSASTSTASDGSTTGSTDSTGSTGSTDSTGGNAVTGNIQLTINGDVFVLPTGKAGSSAAGTTGTAGATSGTTSGTTSASTSGTGGAAVR